MDMGSRDQLQRRVSCIYICRESTESHLLVEFAAFTGVTVVKPAYLGRLKLIMSLNQIRSPVDGAPRAGPS